MRKLKILLSLLIFGIINILLMNNQVKASSNIKVYLEDVEKYSNQENVTVNLCIDNQSDDGIYTFGFDVNYDSSKLEFVSAKQGKGINSSLKLVENVPDEQRVAGAMISLEGFRTSGVYYTFTFKVLDSSKDIPLTVKVREATDVYENDLTVETAGGSIKMISEATDIVEEKSPENQKIEDFTVTEISPIDTIEDFLQEQGNIELAEQDTFSYEIEDSGVIELLPDGTIIPISDGETNVRVKLNDDNLGNLKIEIEDGKVKSIVATSEEVEFDATSVIDNGVIDSEIFDQKNLADNPNESEQNHSIDNKVTNTIENKVKTKTNKIPIIIIIVLVIIFVIYNFIIKKNRG